MEEDLIRLDDSSATSFRSCESGGGLTEYLPTQSLKLLVTEDIQCQDSGAPAVILSDTLCADQSSEELEIAEDQRSEKDDHRRSLGKMSTLQDQPEQDRAESLDFDDLIEVTHEDFPEESGDSESDNNDSGALSNSSAKEGSFKGQKSVSFGLVRTHKICQGVDPPSNHAITESTDCDLTETELCSIEVYELNYRSPTKLRSRNRNRVDKFLQIQSFPGSLTCAENTETVESENVISAEPLLDHPPSSSYHVIQAVDNGCPRQILLAENFDFHVSNERIKCDLKYDLNNRLGGTCSDELASKLSCAY